MPRRFRDYFFLSSKMDSIRFRDRLDSIVQSVFLKYLALFVVVGLGSYVAIHYGTSWFKDASTNTIRVWEQAGVSMAIALTVCLGVFFSRMM